MLAQTCLNCGNVYASDSIFCRRCGTERPQYSEYSPDTEYKHAQLCTAAQGILTGLQLYIVSGSVNPLDWIQVFMVNLREIDLDLTFELEEWAKYAVGLGVIFAAVVGFGTKAFAWNPQFDAEYLAATTVVVLLEETWFRAVMLGDNATGLEAVLVWAQWILYHNGLLHQKYAVKSFDNQHFFQDPVNLLVTAAMGLVCIAVYLGTGGCILASLAVNWVMTCTWLFALNGYTYVDIELSKFD